MSSNKYDIKISNDYSGLKIEFCERFMDEYLQDVKYSRRSNGSKREKISVRSVNSNKIL